MTFSLKSVDALQRLSTVADQLRLAETDVAAENSGIQSSGKNLITESSPFVGNPPLTVSSLGSECQTLSTSIPLVLFDRYDPLTVPVDGVAPQTAPSDVRIVGARSSDRSPCDSVQTETRSADAKPDPESFGSRLVRSVSAGILRCRQFFR